MRSCLRDPVLGASVVSSCREKERLPTGAGDGGEGWERSYKKGCGAETSSPHEY